MDRTAVFQASRQQSRLIRMENRCPPGLQSYYGNIHETVWKLANYYQSIVYLAGLVLGIAFVAEDGGKKKKFRQHCGCR